MPDSLPRRAHRAPRQLDRVEGHGARLRNRAASPARRAHGRDRADEGPPARDRARARGGRPRRRRRRGARRRRHAQRSRRRSRARPTPRSRRCPAGSTNVYARTLGVAHDAARGRAQLLASLRRRSFLRIGLGVANGRRFLFHAGIGFDAAVIKRVETPAAAEALLRAPAVRRGRARHVVPPLRPQAAALRHRAPERRDDRPTPASPSSRRRARTPTSVRRGLTVAPEAGLDTPLSLNAFQSMDARHAHRRRGVGDVVGPLPRAPRRRHPPLRAHRARGHLDAPVPVAGRRRLRRRSTNRLELSYEPDVARPRRSVIADARR